MSQPLVLIVDDNPENLTVIGELLQPAHAVRAANAGARALKLAALQPQPDLVLLDIMMPEMDGFEVLSRLRAQPATAELPVIFLTALNSPAEEERALALGAADYIVKPISPSVLLARVRMHIELKRLREQVCEAQAERLLGGLGVWLPVNSSRDERVIELAGMQALARLVDTRDPQAALHAQRTQVCVATLAGHLLHHGHLPAPLDAAALQRLTHSVPLHDIGMHALPDVLRHKPGPLAPDERALLRQHPLTADAALANAECALAQRPDFPPGCLDFARQMARSHHERWDGAGYPDGLAGAAIPLAARLLAVADTFEALCSPRPWRGLLSRERAFRTVVQESGRQFDPQVVDAFIDTFDLLYAVIERSSNADPSSGRRAAGPQAEHHAAV